MYRLIYDVIDATKGDHVPRHLLNVGWCPDIRVVRRFPGGTIRWDTVHGTNSLQRYCFSGISVDAEGKNVIAVQGSIVNQQGPAFNTFKGHLLPMILGDALQATQMCVMDGDRQEQGSFYYAKALDVYHPNCVLRPCYFHLVTQPLKDPENLGHNHVSPEVYDNIAGLLYDIGTKYETEVTVR
jgi:hypothetical protein